MDIFEAPYKQADGSFLLRFQTPVEFPVELRWEKGAVAPTPDLRIQPHINGFREKTLKDLTKNKVLFKTAPTLGSLSSITPMWGILLNGNAMEWSKTDKWAMGASAAGSMVHLLATAILISRQCIVPFWTTKIVQVLPDKANVIDLDFGCEEEDGESVHSDDLVAEEGVVNLKNPDARKKAMKQHVRELLAKAAVAKQEADEAMDRFFSEFDLSEEESDFSDYEEDD
jgi:hypothetical protein